MRTVIVLSIFTSILSGCGSTSSSHDFLTLDAGPFRAAYLIPDERSQFDLLELIVQAGEADHQGPEGLAHYVEHLAWLPQIDLSDQSSSRHSNAWTSKLATGYFISGPGKDLSQNLARLRSVTEPYSLSDQFMEEEQNIVMREFELRVTENPYYSVYRDMEKKLYGDNPLARSPIGNRRSIDAFTIDAARKLHQQTHSLSNMVLLAKGNISVAALQRDIDLLDANDTIVASGVAVPPDETLRDVQETVLPDIATPGIFYVKTVGIPVELTDAQLSVAHTILANIIDSALPGGIAGPLRFDAFITRTFAFDLFVHSNTHLEMRFNAQPDTGVTVSEIQEAFELALQSSVAAGIPVGTFEKVKQRYIVDLTAVDDKPAYTRNVVHEQIKKRRQPMGYTDILRAAEALTIEDVEMLYSALVGDGRVVIRHVYPEI